MTFAVDAIRRWLWPATLVYLALPVGLFFLGSLRVPAAALLVALLVFAVWRAAGGAARGHAPSGRSLSAGALALGSLPIVAACVAGVLGVWLDPIGDWVQRMEVLNDWIRQPWPVVYRTEAGPVAQVYYIAWFLPAAGVASALGWSAGLWVLLVWSVIGFALAALWLVVLTRAHPLLATAVFVGFSSIEIWQNLLEDGVRNTLQEVFQGDAFRWQRFLWYYPPREAFSFAPTHAIAGWLLAAVLLDASERRDRAFPLALWVGVALLWSPFEALGALPLYAAWWLCADGSPAERLRAQLAPAHLAGAAVALATAAYYAARWFPYAIPEAYRAGVTPVHNGPWLTQEGVDPAAFLGTWAIFCAIQVGVLAVPVLAAARWRPRPEPRTQVVLAAALFLLVLPLFRYGEHNDLGRNSALAAQFVLLVGAADLLARARRHPLAATLLAVCLALGLLTTTARSIRLAHDLERRHAQGAGLHEPTRNVFERQLLLLARKRGRFDRISQYLGSTDSPFFQVLAREPQPRLIETPGPTRPAELPSD